MRVIAGKARRIQLKSMEGMNTRPTTDRIKETLFNMLSQDIYGCHFLDLFSGSGAIGIEALSRGAASAVFVEHNRQAVACIKENLTKTKLICLLNVRQLFDSWMTGSDILTSFLWIRLTINSLRKRC